MSRHLRQEVLRWRARQVHRSWCRRCCRVLGLLLLLLHHLMLLCRCIRRHLLLLSLLLCLLLLGLL